MAPTQPVEHGRVHHAIATACQGFVGVTSCMNAAALRTLRCLLMVQHQGD